MIATLVVFAFLPGYGDQVASVDLSKIREPRRGSGEAAPRKISETPPISVTLRRIINKSEVEVVLTNRGDSPIHVPIGTEPITLLAPTKAERTYLAFNVRVGHAKRDIVGVGRSAANREEPGSSAVLKPGDTAVFKLPMNPAAVQVRRDVEDNLKMAISVSVSLHRIVSDNGKDVDEQLGDEIYSENVLSWP